MQKFLTACGIGHDAPPARAWTLLLIAAVTVSVYGNTAHALLTGHGWAAAAWFAVAPVALFWVTHLVAKTAGRMPSTVVKWLIWVVGIPAALAVAGMAFVVSFRALREWTLHQGGDELSAILLPLIVDVTIALSSVMVLALRPRTDTTEVVPNVVDPAHRPDAQVLIAAPATVPPAVPVSMSTALAVQQGGAQLSTCDAHVQHGGAQVLTAPEPAQEHAAGAAHLPAQQAVTSGDAPDTTAQSDEFPVQRAEANTAESGRVLALVHKGGAQPATGAQVSDEQTMRTAQQPDEQGAQLDPAVEATRLIERGSSRLDEEKLTDVIGRIARGESHNSIATTTGISRNTVMRLAGMVPTEPDDADDEASA